MNQKLKDVEVVSFPLRTLAEFPQILFAEEIELLAEWGDHATKLTTGEVSPASAKEVQFIKVIQGEVPPETRYQHLWLRYLQATNVSTKLNAYERRVQDLEASLVEAQQVIAKLELAGRQQVYHPKDEQDGIDLPIPQSAFCGDLSPTHGVGRVAQVGQGMEQIEISAIESVSTNNGPKLTLSEQAQRYAVMSNDQIFDLCDSGIQRRLTGPYLDAFNDEYKRRREIELGKSKGLYVSDWSGCEACGRPIHLCSCGR